MNFLSLIAEQLRGFAVILLLVHIIRTKSCAGISGKTQFLLALECTTRYLDVFCNFFSYYNTTFKILFTLISYLTLIFIYIVYKKTYEQEYDTCSIEYLVVPVMMLALLFNHYFSTMEILWTFSIYLEAVSLIPQFIFIMKKGEFESVTLIYLSCMVLWRSFFYVLNWIYRFYYDGFYDILVFSSAVVEAILCLYFFVRCLYSVKRKKSYQQNLELILNSPKNVVIGEQLLNKKNNQKSNEEFEKTQQKFDNYLEVYKTDNLVELPGVHNSKN